VRSQAIEQAVELTQQLVAIQSESLMSNATISDFLQDWLVNHRLAVERISYVDPNGVEKVNLIAKLGEGSGGLGFFSHSDTVPGDGAHWEPFNPRVEDGKLYGRGSCDMKGPLAASMIAVTSVDASKLRRPLYIAVAADEEVGHVGAPYTNGICHVERELASLDRDPRADGDDPRVCSQGRRVDYRYGHRTRGTHQPRHRYLSQLSNRAFPGRDGRVSQKHES
jgi:acetylornithine deacetylase/succinyl-diaminopimelate desuccinylase-like protein